MGNVVRAITNAFHFICRAVRKVVSFIVKVVTTVVTVVTRVVKFVAEGTKKIIGFVSNTIKRVKDWFFQTPLGKALTKIGDYIMNNTFIGTAINWVKKKIGDCIDYFFQQTWLGRGIMNLVEKFNNSIVGQFFHDYLSPIIKFASYILPCVGLAGGIIGKVVNTLSNITFYTDKLKDVPGYMKDLILNNRYTNAAFQYGRNKAEQFTNFVKEKVTNNPLYRKGKQFADKVMEKYQNLKSKAQSIYRNVQNYLYSNPYFVSGLSKIQSIIQKAKKKINQRLPNIIHKMYHGYQIFNSSMNNISGMIQNKIKGLCNPYVNKFNRSKLGRFLNPIFKGTNIFIVKPLKFLGKQTIGRVFTKISDKLSNYLKQSSLYKPFVFLNDMKSKAAAQNCFQKTLKQEKKVQRLSSENMIGAYFQKYHGSRDQKAAINKFNTIFKSTSEQQKQKITEDNQIKQLKDYILNQQIKIQKIIFNSRGTHHQESSIGGKITLENDSEHPKAFVIPSGTMFGCQKFRSSQHVVVKQLKGQLQPKQTKQFNLNGFCACSSLKWPRQDSNYSLTSFRMRQFTDNLNQDQVWKLTS